MQKEGQKDLPTFEDKNLAKISEENDKKSKTKTLQKSRKKTTKNLWWSLSQVEERGKVEMF